MHLNELMSCRLISEEEAVGLTVENVQTGYNEHDIAIVFTNGHVLYLRAECDRGDATPSIDVIINNSNIH